MEINNISNATTLTYDQFKEKLREEKEKALECNALKLKEKNDQCKEKPKLRTWEEAWHKKSSVLGEGKQNESDQHENINVRKPRKETNKRNNLKKGNKIEMKEKCQRDIDEKRRKCRERVRRHRDKMSSQRREEKRNKDREYVKRKKEEGAIKTINQLSCCDQRRQRKAWKKRKQESRRKKVTSTAFTVTPPTSPQTGSNNAPERNQEASVPNLGRKSS